MESKEIKVYGTLVNHTLLAGDLPINTTATNHNDVIAYAYQLYDDRFSSTASENYQDVINKRLTGITYDPLSDTTTIDNNLIVNGDTNINGDTHIDGDTTIEGDLHVTESFVVDGDISGISLGNLSNVSSTADSASAGTFLKFDGSEWVPAVIALSDIDGFDSIGTPSEGDIIKYVNNQWTFTKNKLDELYDVDITNKANGSILKWNSTSNKWEIGSDLGSILPQGAEGKVLKYINGQWQASDDEIGATKMSELSDVDLSALAVGKILKWDGNKWTCSSDEGGITKLSQLSDVNISDPAHGDRLVYDSNSGKWVAQGSGGSAAVDLSLGELNNVTEENKQNSSVLIYDNTGGTWKPASYGSSVSTTYTQLTVTFNKIITREAQGYGGMNLDDTDTMADKLYPSANNTYLYATSLPFTIPSGYVISSIRPVSSFGSSAWNVKVYATDLPKAKIANKSNVPYSINGHSKTFNVLSIMSGEYNVKSSDIASALTTTSTSSRFSSVRPLNSNGDLYAYTVESSARSIYRFNGVDVSGIFAGVKINTSGEIVDSDSYESCGGFVSNNGTQTLYLRIDSTSNSATYDNYLTTRYATQKWTVDNSYNWSVVMTSISRDECLRNMYASGTTSPIQINAGVITFQFIANKAITYPDSFQATVILAKNEVQNNSIGGLSVVEGDCTISVNGNFPYAIIPMSATDAQKVLACMIYSIPKNGAVDGNGNAIQPNAANANYNAAYGGFIGSVGGDPDNYDSVKYRYIMYNPS